MYGMTKEDQVIFKQNLDHQYAQQVRKKLEGDDRFWFFLEEAYGQWLCEKRQMDNSCRKIMDRMIVKGSH